MRTIDADELKKNVELNAETVCPKEQLVKILYGIDDAPTIDAVPVVRCKDCKHGKTWKNAGGIEGFKCDLLCVDLSPEAFCSYGERKDGANDG